MEGRAVLAGPDHYALRWVTVMANAMAALPLEP